MGKEVMMKVDVDFAKLVKQLKKEFDFGSNRRTTKEISKILRQKKRKLIL